MGKRDILTKGLAITGTVLALAPFLVLAVRMPRLIRLGVLGNAYIIPAEFFPAALLGAGLLFWAARRARLDWKLIAWGLGLATVFLAGGLAAAAATGLAAGTAAMGGWETGLVAGLMAAHALALLALAVGGVLLLARLFRPAKT
jgi:hypothetical protein